MKGKTIWDYGQVRCKKNPQINNKYGNAAIFIFNYLFIYSFGRGGVKIRTPLHKILHPPQQALGNANTLGTNYVKSYHKQKLKSRLH